MTTMIKSSSVLTGLLLAAIGIFAFSGCFVVGDSGEGRDWWYYCDDTGCYRCNEGGCELPDTPPGPGPSFCTGDEDCPSGTSCDIPSGYCVTNPSGCAVSAECSHGYVCLAGHCTPGHSPCHNDSACGTGAYCENGACKDSGLCAKDVDCAIVGKDLVCDDRGSCVPAPPGPKTCTDAAACDGGALCVDGGCGTCSGDCGGGKTCALAVHCGDGRACLDGQCVNTCQTKSDCGSAQVCVDHVCQLPKAGACVKD
ncbi:MAG: hypothetical protein KAI47_01935, partial [Deltaproteobacteria bacterium]|nr:hypothetical protein [Deltaproteobacteria bacterium]